MRMQSGLGGPHDSSCTPGWRPTKDAYHCTKNVFYNVFAPEICTRPRRRAVGALSFSQNKIERLLDKPQSMHGIMQYGRDANRPPQ